MRTLIHVVTYLFIMCSGSTRAEKIQFKNPLFSPEEFSQQLATHRARTIFISGAGPAGLIAAIIAKREGADFVIVTEKRDEFVRRNTLAFRPEAEQMLEQLNLLSVLKRYAILPNTEHVIVHDLARSFFAEDDHTPHVLPDWNLAPSEVMKDIGWPRIALEIKDLQRALMEEIHTLDNIFVLHGYLDVDGEEFVDAHFVSAGSYGDFFVEKPRLIMVAEGVHSRTRDKFVSMVDVQKPMESIASGVVSLAPWFDFAANNSTGHVSIVVDTNENIGSFAVWRPQTKDLFLNTLLNETLQSLPHEEIIQRAAFNILSHEQRYFSSLTLPETHQSLEVKREQSFRTDITFQKSPRVVLRQNLVLLSDSVRSGSPKGGVLLSTTLSFELHEMILLWKALFSNGSITEALKRYEKRLLEFADFCHWHTLT